MKSILHLTLRTIAMLLVPLFLLSAWLAAQAPADKTLDVYFIDVEGGHATLYVSPSGQSMLVDTGYPGFEGRDANRIIAAATRASVKQIDYLVTTHYHGDHVGGVTALAERFPIRNFVDHGPTSEQGAGAALYNTYVKVRSKGAHIEVQPGDQIPVEGLNVRVLSSGGGLLSVPLEGGGIPNPLCATFLPMKDETSDDAHSVGTLVTYGRFRLINLGDLSWNQEFGLVCPTNRIGTVDVLLASQHGDDEAGSATFVHAIRPKVAVINNGPKKAAIQPIVQTLRTSPDIQDVWQLHYSLLGNRLNVSGEFIANVGEDVDTGHWLLLSARSDGSFTMTNGRTGFTKTYAVKN
ncbi:MAG: ComEC/Rec2 family competence protein [Vicinamibacterales bacterium]